MNTNRQVILYGLGGPATAYTVLQYYVLFDENITIDNIWGRAAWLRAINPSIQRVYAIDNRRGLKKDYMESMRLNSMESHAIFKDILEREGREIKP